MKIDWVNRNSSCLFTAVYGCPHKQFRKHLWADLNLMAASISSPWLLAGDFNAILGPDERRGGLTRRAQGCQSFNHFLHSNGLLDMGFNPKFTWRRGTLLMRLDRAICNPDWLHAFPDYEVDHFPKIHSDHRPILICLVTQRQQSPAHKPFKFLASWLTHPDFSSLVQQSWSQEDCIMNSIKSFSDEALRWNTETFGVIGKCKRRLLSRIRGIQVKWEDQPNSSYDFLSELELSLKDEFEAVCFQEVLLWLQKSSSDWICLGDRNTHYYHMKALLRRKRNCISQLKNREGIWMKDEAILANHAKEFFNTLYSLEDPVFHPPPVRGAFLKIVDHHLLALERTVTLDETKHSLFEMKPLKSLGDDGLHAIFLSISMEHRWP
ncbi:hypothetical protein K1719_041363 [Acacia pycnantha]|nr:hypothetical protein K1719_041363 [Acacia pycnantha]